MLDFDIKGQIFSFEGFIVGYPGETDSDHSDNDLVKSCHFHTHLFIVKDRAHLQQILINFKRDCKKDWKNYSPCYSNNNN